MLKPYYEEENITLYHGECLEIMQALAEEGLKVDAVINDPPYGKTQNEWDIIIDIPTMWARYKKLSKAKTSYIFTSSQPYTSMLVMSNLAEFKFETIWDKVSPVDFLNVKLRPMRRHENIIVFCGENQTYNPQLHPEKTIKRFSKPKTQGLTGSYGYFKNNKKNYVGYPHSIVAINRVNNLSKEDAGLNPTQKPEELLEYLVLTYTNEGDLVLDNTFGSGTTAVACKKLNRRFVGIELREEQCKIAVQRLKETNPFYQKQSKKSKEFYEGLDLEDWLK